MRPHCLRSHALELTAAGVETVGAALDRAGVPHWRIGQVEAADQAGLVLI